MENLHVFKLIVIPSTQRLPRRIKIRSERFKQSVYITAHDSWDGYNDGLVYLSKNGFNIIGQAEGEGCHYALSTTFEPLPFAKDNTE